MLHVPRVSECWTIHVEPHLCRYTVLVTTHFHTNLLSSGKLQTQTRGSMQNLRSVDIVSPTTPEL